MRKSLVLLLVAALTLGVALPVAADDSNPPPPPDPPTSIITDPVNGAILTSVPILVKGTASDQDGVARVELDIQGATGTTTVSVTITATRQGSADWQYNWNPTQTGTYSLVSKATDVSTLDQDPATLKPITVTFNPQASPSPSPTSTTSPTATPSSQLSPTPSATPTLYPTASPSTAPSFPDLAGHWAESLVMTLTSRGIISGYPDGTFHPDQSITRGEFCAILGRAMNLTPSTADGSFSDLAGHWAKGYILAMVEKDAVKGYPDGSFGPDQPIKRDEIAAIMARVKSLLVLPGKATFSDVNADHWAFGVIEACASAKILSGYPDGSFHPENSATRAEASAVIARGLDL